MTTPTVQAYPTVAALIAAAANTTIQEIRRVVEARGRCTIALSGGETPRALYAAWASQADRLPWSKTVWCFGDERWVPPDHSDSNYRMVDETLFSRVSMPGSAIIAVPTGAADPAASAAGYEAALRARFPGDAWPAFDVALMGLGPDGHTASLFPGDPALDEHRAWVSATRAGRPVPDRITLTIPVFRHARWMMMLVAGAAKAEAVAQTLHGPRDPRRWPAQSVTPIEGPCLWFLDREAGSRLGLAA